jgi:hypothetical protein
MKDPSKLQKSLLGIARHSGLHLQLPEDRGWNELELKSAAFVVQDHLNLRGGNEGLEEWLDRYRFFAAEKKAVNRCL